ncbi:MAG: LpxI family protein [Hyphococcus sp.]
MARWRKLGIIAGGGALPAQIANACQARNDSFHLIRLAGYADESLAALPGDDCAIGEAGKVIRILKNEQCDAVVFAGIVQRPDFKNLKVDWRGAAMLPKLVAAATRGDGALLNALVDTIESEGLIVVGVDEAVGGLLAPSGALGQVSPSANETDDIRKGDALIAALGPFDVGQGAVVANGLVLAIEAAEGTDGMLARCAVLPMNVKGGEKTGVLVKRPKPGQELRIDLPTIGLQTVENAAAADLAGIAVKAGAALIVDRARVAERADALGLFVYGYSTEDIENA